MTPVKVCCLYKAAVTQIQCTAAPVVGKMHPLLVNAALQIRLTAALRHCNDTCEDFLLTQSCSDQIKCTAAAVVGKKHSALLSVAVTAKLTAAS